MWGRATKTTDAEANDIQYSYDLKGQRTLTSKEDPIPFDMMEEDRVDVKTEYDGLGRRTRVLNDNNTAVLRWQYDRLGRLTKLQYATTTPRPTSTTSPVSGPSSHGRRPSS